MIMESQRSNVLYTQIHTVCTFFKPSNNNIPVLYPEHKAHLVKRCVSFVSSEPGLLCGMFGLKAKYEFSSCSFVILVLIFCTSLLLQSADWIVFHYRFNSAVIFFGIILLLLVSDIPSKQNYSHVAPLTRTLPLVEIIYLFMLAFW